MSNTHAGERSSRGGSDTGLLQLERGGVVDEEAPELGLEEERPIRTTSRMRNG
jgi:hypothetical protein